MQHLYLMQNHYYRAMNLYQNDLPYQSENYAASEFLVCRYQYILWSICLRTWYKYNWPL